MNNLTIRTISGVGFIIVMLACLLFCKYLFAALILFMMSAMMMEFFSMTMGDEFKFTRLLAIIAGNVLFILLFSIFCFGLPPRFITLVMLPVLTVLVSYLYAKEKTESDKFSNICTGFLYIAVPLSLSNLIAFRGGEFNTTLLLCFFVIIWFSDTGAYLIGSMFGKKSKKLFPSVSPKKTWVGFWGGMAFAILSACILYLTGLFKYPLVHCVILAVIMDVAGVYGDLFESQLKRNSGIKDSGKIIPGHGGMLDRFDSALFAIPMGATYLAVINLL